MFLGHLAAGLAAKPAAPRASLGVLVGAALLLDLAWPIFLLAGWERVSIVPGITAFSPLAFDSYPWSHSLAATLVWSAVAALAYLLATRDARGAAVVAAVVGSHWVLDAVSHRPDLPLWPGGSLLVGLGLWNSVGATVAVEGLLLAAGVAIYLVATRSRDRVGTWSLAAFVGTAVLLFAGSAAGPPPPSARILAYSGLTLWLVPLWAAWLDRHRTARPAVLARPRDLG